MRGRTHGRWVAVVCVVLSVAAAAWWSIATRSASEVSVPAAAPRAASALAPPQQVTARANPLLPQRPHEADSVGNASDLRGVFDAYIDSADEALRRTAVRAHAACVPAFLPQAGEPASPEPLIQSLPAAHRAEREAAYRALFARCYRFFGEGRAKLEPMRERVSAAQWQEPGVRVRAALGRGDRDDAIAILGAALSGADAATVASLSGTASALVEEQDDPGLAVRARAIDAALMLAACDLGMHCGVDALRALQMCAVESLCDGDVPTRVMAQAASSASDPVAVQRERTRLLALFRSGRALTAADLFAAP